MAANTEFVDHLLEVFEPFGDVEARRMFGGHGLFHDGLMFGLIASEQLYLKADGDSRSNFEDRDLPQFEYMKRNKPARLSYFLAPEEIFDDPDEAHRWATLAYEAALRSRR